MSLELVSPLQDFPSPLALLTALKFVMFLHFLSQGQWLPGGIEGSVSAVETQTKPDRGSNPHHCCPPPWTSLLSPRALISTYSYSISWHSSHGWPYQHYPDRQTSVEKLSKTDGKLLAKQRLHPVRVLWFKFCFLGFLVLNYKNCWKEQ